MSEFNVVATDAPQTVDAQLQTSESGASRDKVLEICRQFIAPWKMDGPQEDVRQSLKAAMGAAKDMFLVRNIQIGVLLDYHGVLRFNELATLMPHMSTRTVSDRLSFLQDAKLVDRTVYDERPPRVEYQLTSRGKSLMNLLYPAIDFFVSAEQDVDE